MGIGKFLKETGKFTLNVITAMAGAAEKMNAKVEEEKRKLESKSNEELVKIWREHSSSIKGIAAGRILQERGYLKERRKS